MPAAGLGDLMALLKLGGGVGRLGIEEQRHVVDFFTRSATEILERYFSHELVQALFGFDAVVGHYASPHAPGTAYVLLHHVFGEAAGVAGAWGHAIGGMGAITQAMARAAREEGVEIVLDAPVEEIIVEQGKAAGAVAGGKTYRAKAVAAGVNPKLLFDRLLPDGAVDAGDRDADARLEERERDLPDERRSVGAAALLRLAGAGRSHDRRHHHGAVARLYGPRLSDRADRGLVARADRRDADPVDAGRQPRPRRAAMSPACSASISPMRSKAAGTRAATRRPTISSPMSIASRLASPLRCSAARRCRRSISSAASA